MISTRINFEHSYHFFKKKMYWNSRQFPGNSRESTLSKKLRRKREKNQDLKPFWHRGNFTKLVVGTYFTQNFPIWLFQTDSIAFIPPDSALDCLVRFHAISIFFLVAVEDQKGTITTIPRNLIGLAWIFKVFDWLLDFHERLCFTLLTDWACQCSLHCLNMKITSNEANYKI